MRIISYIALVFFSLALESSQHQTSFFEEDACIEKTDTQLYNLLANTNMCKWVLNKDISIDKIINTIGYEYFEFIMGYNLSLKLLWRKYNNPDFNKPFLTKLIVAQIILLCLGMNISN